MLIRRNRSTGELAYYRCYSPAPVPLTVLVTVAQLAARPFVSSRRRRRSFSRYGSASVNPMQRGTHW